MESSCLGTRAACELGLDPGLPFVEQAEAFARMLSEYVPIGGTSQRVMLERVCRLTDRFVVFRKRGRGLRCETSSNCFLPRDRRLKTAEECRLTELGWHPPDGGFPRRLDDEGCPNWYFDVALERTGAAAMLLIRTLDEICLASTLAEVFIRSSCAYYENRDLCGRYLIASGKECCECDPAEVFRLYHGG